MQPAPLSTIRLPALLLLLLHAGARAEPGQSSNQTACQEAIREMRRDLERPAPLPLNSTNLLDIIRLQNTSWRVSLSVFMNATKNITGGEKIKKNLKFLKSCLPKKATSVGNPIVIKDRSWDDFRRKLQYYLRILSAQLDQRPAPCRAPGTLEQQRC